MASAIDTSEIVSKRQLRAHLETLDRPALVDLVIRQVECYGHALETVAGAALALRRTYALVMFQDEPPPRSSDPDEGPIGPLSVDEVYDAIRGCLRKANDWTRVNVVRDVACGSSPPALRLFPYAIQNLTREGKVIGRGWGAGRELKWAPQAVGVEK